MICWNRLLFPARAARCAQPRSRPCTRACAGRPGPAPLTERAGPGSRGRAGSRDGAGPGRALARGRVARHNTLSAPDGRWYAAVEMRDFAIDAVGHGREVVAVGADLDRAPVDLDDLASMAPSTETRSPIENGRSMPTAMPANTSESVLCRARPRTMAMTPEVATRPRWAGRTPCWRWSARPRDRPART